MINPIKILGKSKKRLGQGIGSGKGGHTSSRGQKGQKSRGKVGVIFEGVKVKKSLFKRLPFQRGKGKFDAKLKPLSINIGQLNVFENDAVINIESLVKKGLLDLNEATKKGVKILATGKLDKKLKVLLRVSASAAKKIQDAGGVVEQTVGKK